MWYSVELPAKEAMLLKVLLRNKGVKYESSACYGLTHFEILLEAGSEDYCEVEEFIKLAEM